LAFVNRSRWPSDLLGSNWSNDNYRMNGNVYWDTRPGAAENLKFANGTWEQWRARGHDTNSVIADPLFVAPATFDLRLQPESPALKLGFKPIDLSRVGVRPEAQRKDERLTNTPNTRAHLFRTER
jgi:hypothetical protein